MRIAVFDEYVLSRTITLMLTTVLVAVIVSLIGEHTDTYVRLLLGGVLAIELAGYTRAAWLVFKRDANGR